MSSDNADRQLDGQLRAVPVPEGLLGRLQSIAYGQEQIDRELKDVACPPGMIASLHDIPQREAGDPAAPAGKPTDDRRQIDRNGHRVLPRAKLIAESASDDVRGEEELDEQLRRVDVPATLLPRLRRIPAMDVWPRRQRWLPAATIVMAASVLFFLMLSATVDSIHRDSMLTSVRDIDVDGYRWEADSASVAFEVDSTSFPTAEVGEVPPDRVGTPLPPVGFREVRRPPLLLVEATRNFIASHDVNVDIFLSQYGALPAPQYDDDVVPDLRLPVVIPARGYSLPITPGYDREFMLKYGVRPPVFPGAHPRLQTLTVPLSPTTESYDEARLLLDEEQWPMPLNVRAEDFLAALRYRLKPPSDGGLALHVAAGPAPFGGVRSHLLQVGVQAGEVARRRQHPVHIVVALDTSNSMKWSRKWESAREALDELARQLKSGDRLSLISFNERIDVVLDRGRSRFRELIQDAMMRLTPGGGTNLCGAMHVALTHAAQTRNAQHRTQVVLLTDDRSSIPKKPVAELTRLIESLRSQVDIAIVDVDQGQEAAPTLVAWAKAAGTPVVRANNAQTVRWSLASALVGDPVVAKRTVVRMRFDPNTVIAYRLIGHDITRVESPLVVQADVTMRSHESTMCLFEFWLRPNGGTRVGEIQLEWADRKNIKQRRTRVLHRWEIATESKKMPPSLQAAAVAAETGEVLRGSPLVKGVLPDGRFEFQRRPENLSHVLEWLKREGPIWPDQPGVARFLRVLKRLERVGREKKR